jgi:hypothetical protein
MIDPIFRLKFMQIFNECMRQNYDANTARNLANLELTGRLYHDETPNNHERIHGDNDSCGINGYPKGISA